MSELIISIIQDFLIAIKPLEYRDELSCLSTKLAEFRPSEYYTVEPIQLPYSRLCILVPNNIIYFGLLFLIENKTVVELWYC